MSWETLLGADGLLFFTAQTASENGAGIVKRMLEPDTLVLVVGGLIALAAVLGAVYNKHARTVAEKELKEQMLERGMSVDEIERVLLAGKDFSSKEAVRRMDRQVAGGNDPAKPA